MTYVVVKKTREGVESIVHRTDSLGDVCGWMEAHTVGNRKHCAQFLGSPRQYACPSYSAGSIIAKAMYRAEYRR